MYVCVSTYERSTCCGIASQILQHSRTETILIRMGGKKFQFLHTLLQVMELHFAAAALHATIVNINTNLVTR